MPKTNTPTTGILKSGWLVVVIFAIQIPLVVFIFTLGDKLQANIISGIHFPIGNLMVWCVVGLFPVGTYIFLQQLPDLFSDFVFRILKRIGLIAVFCGVLWGFIGYFLAGNWAFHFSSAIENHQERYAAFWFITAVPFVLSILIGFVTIVALIISSTKRNA